MAIFTGNDNFTSKLNQMFDTTSTGIVECFAALNIVLSITASLGNALILIALQKLFSLYPPTNLFFRCLAVTDLCVGLIVQPLYTINIISLVTKMNENVLHYIYEACGVSSVSLYAISVLTLTAISVDRLLALSLGLRYRHVVTLRRVRVVIICIWLIGSSAGIIRLWRVDLSLHEVTVIVTLSLVISFFCYTIIHLKLRRQQAQVQNNFRQRQVNVARIPLNIARYKKIVSSILWVKVALVGCFVPFAVVAVLDANRIKVEGPWLATITLVYFNSSLNPILYCWKIKEIKESVKDTIKNLTCYYKFSCNDRRN